MEENSRRPLICISGLLYSRREKLWKDTQRLTGERLYVENNGLFITRVSSFDLHKDIFEVPCLYFDVAAIATYKRKKERKTDIYCIHTRYILYMYIQM